MAARAPIAPKVKAGAGGSTIGGAAAVIIVWALTEWGHEPTPEVIAALTALITLVAGFAAGYLKAP